MIFTMKLHDIADYSNAKKRLITWSNEFIYSNRLKNWWFVTVSDNLFTVLFSDDLSGFSMHFQQFGDIKSGLLEDLALLDVDLMKRIG